MGAIPIVRRHRGLAPLFDSEPVLQVDQWTDVTPQLLKDYRPPTMKAQIGPGPRSRSLWQPFWHRRFEADAAALRRVDVTNLAGLPRVTASNAGESRRCDCATMKTASMYRGKTYCDMNNSQSVALTCAENCVHVPGTGNRGAGICVAK